MATVLVRTADGSGVVRAPDGSVVVTEDVTQGVGTHLRTENPHHPGTSWVDEKHSVVGGLLAPGAVSVEVIDDLGRRTTAVVGDDAYAAVIAQPSDGWEPIVCCRDGRGEPVRRPLPAEYPREPVTDADEPCPACGATAWDEYVPPPDEQWRGGRGGPGGRVIPNPVVSCRTCGHEEPEGSFFGAAGSDRDEDDAARRERVVRARAQASRQRWYANTMLLRGTGFPIYAAVGWPAELGGSGARNGVTTRVAITHDRTPPVGSDPASAVRRALKVSTSIDEHARAPPSRHARRELEVWAANQLPPTRWAGRSRAAITLSLAAHQRRGRGLVLAATPTDEPIAVDGAEMPFARLTTSGGSWVAVRVHHDLLLTVSGHGLEAHGLALEPVADPHRSLVGPRPPEPE